MASGSAQTFFIIGDPEDGTEDLKAFLSSFEKFSFAATLPEDFPKDLNKGFSPLLKKKRGQWMKQKLVQTQTAFKGFLLEMKGISKEAPGMSLLHQFFEDAYFIVLYREDSLSRFVLKKLMGLIDEKVDYLEHLKDNRKSIKPLLNRHWMLAKSIFISVEEWEQKAEEIYQKKMAPLFQLDPQVQVPKTLGQPNPSISEKDYPQTWLEHPKRYKRLHFQHQPELFNDDQRGPSIGLWKSSFRRWVGNSQWKNRSRIQLKTLLQTEQRPGPTVLVLPGLNRPQLKSLVDHYDSLGAGRIVIAIPEQELKELDALKEHPTLHVLTWGAEKVVEASAVFKAYKSIIQEGEPVFTIAWDEYLIAYQDECFQSLKKLDEISVSQQWACRLDLLPSTEKGPIISGDYDPGLIAWKENNHGYIPQGGLAWQVLGDPEPIFRRFYSKFDSKANLQPSPDQVWDFKNPAVLLRPWNPPFWNSLAQHRMDLNGSSQITVEACLSKTIPFSMKSFVDYSPKLKESEIKSV